jgi:hypothetical protein
VIGEGAMLETEELLAVDTNERKKVFRQSQAHEQEQSE